MVIQQLMGADAETHNQTLGEVKGTPQRRERGIAGARGVEDTRRTQPTEPTKQGSWGLIETEATITDPVWV